MLNDRKNIKFLTAIIPSSVKMNKCIKGYVTLENEIE